MPDPKIIADNIGVSDKDLMLSSLAEIKEELRVIKLALSSRRGRSVDDEDFRKKIQSLKSVDEIKDELIKAYDLKRKEDLAQLKAEFAILKEKFSSLSTSTKTIVSGALGSLSKKETAQSSSVQAVQEEMGAGLRSLFGKASTWLAPQAKEKPKEEHNLSFDGRTIVKEVDKSTRQIGEKIDKKVDDIHVVIRDLRDKISRGQSLSESDIKKLTNSVGERTDKKIVSQGELTDKKIDRGLEKLDKDRNETIAKFESQFSIMREKFSTGSKAMRSIASSVLGAFSKKETAESSSVQAVQEEMGEGIRGLFKYGAAKVSPLLSRKKSQEEFNPYMDRSTGGRGLAKQIKVDTELILRKLDENMDKTEKMDEENDEDSLGIKKRLNMVYEDVGDTEDETEELREKVDNMEDYMRTELPDEIVGKITDKMKDMKLGGEGEGGGGLLSDLLDLRRSRFGRWLSRTKAFRSAKLLSRKVGRLFKLPGGGAAKGGGLMSRAGSLLSKIPGASKATGLASQAASFASKIPGVSKVAGIASKAAPLLGKVGGALKVLGPLVSIAQAGYGAYSTLASKEERGKQAMELSDLKKSMGGGATGAVGASLASNLGLSNIGKNYREKGVLMGTLSTAGDVLSAPVQWGKNIGTFAGLAWDKRAAQADKAQTESSLEEKVKAQSSDDYEKIVQKYMNPPSGQKVSESSARISAVEQALKNMSALGPVSSLSNHKNKNIAFAADYMRGEIFNAANSFRFDQQKNKFDNEKAAENYIKTNFGKNMGQRWDMLKETAKNEGESIDPSLIKKGDEFYKTLLPNRLKVIEEAIKNKGKEEKAKTLESKPAEVAKSTETKPTETKPIEPAKPAKAIQPPNEKLEQIIKNIDENTKSNKKDEDNISGNVSKIVKDENTKIIDILTEFGKKLDKLNESPTKTVIPEIRTDYAFAGMRNLSKGIA